MKEMSRLNKKGFAITFSWIFSLIAGALIFLFLVYFSFQHTDLFGQRSNVLIREEFDNAFGALKSTDITTRIELDKETTLRFQCFEKKILFGVDNGDKKEIPGKIIAAPDTLTGYNFSIKTVKLVRPFNIATFIYIDSEQDRKTENNNPLQMAVNYAGSNYNDCIVPLIEERFNLVRKSYINKIDYLNSKNMMDSDGSSCSGRYSNLRDKLDMMSVDDVLGNTANIDGLERINKNLVSDGCEAVF